MGKIRTSCIAAIGVLGVCGGLAQPVEEIPTLTRVAAYEAPVKVIESLGESDTPQPLDDVVEAIHSTPQEIVAVIASEAGLPTLQAELDTISDTLAIPESAVDMEFIMDLASDLGIHQDMLDLFASSVSDDDKQSIENITSQFTEEEVSKIKGVADHVTENLTPEESNRLNEQLSSISLKELSSIRNAILSLGDAEMDGIRDLLKDIDVANISSITDILDGAPSLVAPLVPLALEDGELIDGSLVDNVRDTVNETVATGTDAVDAVRETVSNTVASGTAAIREAAETVIGFLAETFAIDLTAMTQDILTESNVMKALSSGNLFSDRLQLELGLLEQSDNAEDRELYSFGSELLESSGVVLDDLDSILESLRAVSVLNLDVRNLGDSVRSFTGRLYREGSSEGSVSGEGVQEEGSALFSAADLFSDFSIRSMIPTDFTENLQIDLSKPLSADRISMIMKDPTLLRDAISSGNVNMPWLTEMVDSYVTGGNDVAGKIIPLGDEGVAGILKDPLALKEAISGGRVDMSWMAELFGDRADAESAFNVEGISRANAVVVEDAIEKVKQGAEDLFVKAEEAEEVKAEEAASEAASEEALYSNRKIRGNRRQSRMMDY